VRLSATAGSSFIPYALCPDTIPRNVVEDWNKLGETTEAIAGTYVKKFNDIRANDKGAFQINDVLPTGVLIVTDFADGTSLIYQSQPVRPIVHYRSSGVFETTSPYTAIQAGACMTIQP